MWKLKTHDCDLKTESVGLYSTPHARFWLAAAQISFFYVVDIMLFMALLSEWSANIKTEQLNLVQKFGTLEQPRHVFSVFAQKTENKVVCMQ